MLCTLNLFSLFISEKKITKHELNIKAIGKILEMNEYLIRN